jgi:hypothetical protein
MGERTVDRDAIRQGGDRFSDVGGDIWRHAGRLDEDPYFLRASDWGDSGGQQDALTKKYEVIRSAMRDFLRDGAKALTELHDVLYSVAARTAHDEEVSRDDLEQIGKRIGQ